MPLKLSYFFFFFPDFFFIFALRLGFDLRALPRTLRFAGIDTSYFLASHWISNRN